MPTMISLACGDYDRTEALRSGEVRAEGLEIAYVPIQSPPEIFARMIIGSAFDAAEMSLSSYVAGRAAGNFPFVAIPVFPVRFFRHGNIFINRRRGIEKPKTLRGSGLARSGTVKLRLAGYADCWPMRAMSTSKP